MKLGPQSSISVFPKVARHLICVPVLRLQNSGFFQSIKAWLVSSQRSWSTEATHLDISKSTVEWWSGWESLWALAWLLDRFQKKIHFLRKRKWIIGEDKSLAWLVFWREVQPVYFTNFFRIKFERFCCFRWMAWWIMNEQVVWCHFLLHTGNGKDDRSQHLIGSGVVSDGWKSQQGGGEKWPDPGLKVTSCWTTMNF